MKLLRIIPTLLVLGILSACATKKPIQFTAPYTHGNYRVVLLDIQPGDKLKERIAKNTYSAQEYTSVRQRIITKLMPKLASKNSTTPVGLSIFIDELDIETIGNGSISTRAVLWHPETKYKIAEMPVRYSESGDLEGTKAPSAIGMPGGLIGVAVGSIIFNTMDLVHKKMNYEEEIDRQMDVYTSTVVAVLYPPVPAVNQKDTDNKVRRILLGR